MKRNVLFKTLVDLLYYLHFIGLIAILLIPLLPIGKLSVNQINIKEEAWPLLNWVIAIAILITYIIFLRGLYYLRKMSKHLLSNLHFSENIHLNLRKSGIYFLLTGIIILCFIGVVWFINLKSGYLGLSYNTDVFIPLFLIIIGMFFIIQSNTLYLAKNIKEENDLTV